MVIQHTKGHPEVVLVKNCKAAMFQGIASWLQQKLEIQYTQIAETADSCSWQFEYNGIPFALCYNTAAIALHPLHQTETDGEMALRELVQALSNKIER